MKIGEIVKNGFVNTSFTVTNKASSMAMCVYLSIVINQNALCSLLTILVFVKVLKVLVNNREITLCIPKLR